MKFGFSAEMRDVVCPSRDECLRWQVEKLASHQDHQNQPRYDIQSPTRLVLLSVHSTKSTERLSQFTPLVPHSCAICEYIEYTPYRYDQARNKRCASPKPCINSTGKRKIPCGYMDCSKVHGDHREGERRNFTINQPRHGLVLRVQPLDAICMVLQ